MAVIAHSLLDDGFDWCPSCAVLVRAARFCGQCGGSLSGQPAEKAARKVRTCPDPQCGAETRSTFCECCGSRVVPVEIEQLERGETTLAAMVSRTAAAWTRWRARNPLTREPRADERAAARGSFAEAQARARQR